MTIGDAQKIPDIRVDESQVSEETRFIKANRLRLIGDYEEAERALKQLITSNPLESAYHFELSELYRNLDTPEKAIEELKSAIELEPDNTWYWQSLANIAEQIHDPAQALEAYKALYDIHPDRLSYLENIALQYLENNEPQLAIRTLTELTEREGYTLENVRRLHLLYDGLADYDNALHILDQYLTIHGDDIHMLHVASAYALQRFDTSRANSYIERILDIDPHDAQALAGKMQRTNSGDAEQLITYLFDKKQPLDSKLKWLIPILTEYDPHNPEVPLSTLITIGDTLQILHGANAKTLALSGDIYMIAEQYQKARTAYEASLKYENAHFEVWNQLMYALAYLHEFNSLALYAEQCIDLFPNQPTPYAFLGLAQHTQGQAHDAEALFHQAKIIAGKNNQLIQDVHFIQSLQ